MTGLSREQFDAVVLAAHEYAEEGWAVLPMAFLPKDGSPGEFVKMPLTKWRNGTAGQVATTDHAVIDGWAKEFKHRWHGVGVATGAASGGLYVVDADLYKKGTSPLASVPGAQVETLSAITARDGRHLWFRDTSGLNLAGSAGTLGSGIDTRGEGNYAVAPPSVNPHTGQGYVWANEDVPVAPLPPEVVAALTAERSGPSGQKWLPYERRTVRVAPADYARSSLAGYLEDFAAAEDGTWNDTLNVQAFKAARYFPNGYLNEDDTRQALLTAAVERGIPHAEALLTINSGFRASLKDTARMLTLVQKAAAAEPEDEVLRSIRALFLADDDSSSDHLAAIRSDEDVMALDDPQFVIDSWVPRGFFTTVFGAPGVKKTFALLGMTLAVRRGGKWQNNKTQQGATLFYQGEGLEQLKPRIRAWEARYPLAPEKTRAPGGYLDVSVDMTTPEGAAAVVRTVQGYQDSTGVPVQMVVFDPLVEFMTGEPNGEGMQLATRGLRAVARYLDIAVVVGHHTNAIGDRARGADYHRQRCGAHLRMEELDGGLVGIVQEKQKNGEKVALILEAAPEGESIVLEWEQFNLPALDYLGMRESGDRSKKAERKATEDDDKRASAERLLLTAIREQPGMSTRRVLDAASNHGVGRTTLSAVLTALTGPRGSIRVERSGGSSLHFAVQP